jgi:2-polyprenyl-3-methyl-5-hydroxy-6-metoxy-1,4-benzoquinol methylase
MDAEYASMYGELYRNHWWWRVRERILLDTIEAVVRVRPVRILDVGCGDGLFFDVLQRFGDVTGIETDPTTLGKQNQWADRIVIGEFDESFTPPDPFDVILMLDVIEHVPNADRLLRNAARVLTPNGHLLVTVPAFQWLWTSHDEVNHHVKRYAAADLRRTLEDAGLTVLQTRYLFQSLVLPKLAVRMAEALELRRTRLPRIPRPPVSAALQFWFWTEHRVAGWLPFGTSIMALAGVPPR